MGPGVSLQRLTLESELRPSLCHNRLRQSFVVQNCTPVYLQTTQDLTERALRTDGFDVGQLARERQPVRVTTEDGPFTRRQTSSNATGQQIARIDGEPIHLTEPTIPKNADAITRNEHFAKFRTLELERRPRRHDDPTPAFRDVLLIQRLSNAQDDIDDFNLTRGRVTTDCRDRRAGDAEVDVAGR